MAIIKQRMLKKNASGTYDTIHLETDASCITGILPVANGGTGASSLSGLASSIASSVSTASIKCGTYGNRTDASTASVSVNLGAKPRAVIAWKNKAGNGSPYIYISTPSVAGCSTYGVDGSTVGGKLTITTTGFTATGLAAYSAFATYFIYIAFM